MDRPKLSRYRVMGRIGAGGMGVIYRAEDTDLGREVALKFLPPELAQREDYRLRFLREARMAASLNHPNVYTIHEVRTVKPGQETALGPDEEPIRVGTPYIAMELIQGETLRAILDRKKMLSIMELVNISIQVGEGLSEAHSHGIVHRDLNPKNVMVTRQGRAKILDFGLAATAHPRRKYEEGSSSLQTISSEMEDESKIAGTVAYLSPEQALGRSVDPRADLFAFGILLYEMATGKRPFQGENATSTLAKILEAEPPPLSELRREAPASLESMVRRCLQKEPSARYSDSREILSELKELRRTLRSTAEGNIPGGPEPMLTASAEASPPSTPSVAVFPFSFRGGEQYAYLREGLVDLLSTKMDGAGDLRAVDASVVIGRTAREGEESLLPQKARDIARELGADIFIQGMILEAGGEIHLDAVLLESCEGIEAVAKATVRGPGAKIFDLVDELTTKLLADRCGGPDSRLVQIAAMTTNSFAALKAYLEGEKEMRLMRRLPAVEFFQQAVRADPRFALAWYRLSVAALWSGKPEIAGEAVQQAIQHSERLSDRDHHLLTAFHAVLRGANDEAEHLYRSLLGSYPDDVEAWYQLGELLFHWGPQCGRPLSESREAWERLVRLDPRHVNGHVHLATIIAGTGRRSELESLVRRILELSPGGDSALWVLALRAFALGDASAQEEVIGELRRASDLAVTWAIRFVGAYLGDLGGGVRVARLLTEEVRTAEVRALGHLNCAHLELARGRKRIAHEELKMAGKLFPSSAILHQGIISMAPHLPISEEELRETRANLVQWDHCEVLPAIKSSPWLAPHEDLCGHLRFYLLALLSARLGEVEVARHHLNDLEEAPPTEEMRGLLKDLAASVKAQIAWAEGDAENALVHLQRARMETRFDLTFSSPFCSQAFERFSRAEAFHRLGKYQEAQPWFSSFAQNSVYDLMYVAPGLFRLGELHEARGEWEDALHACDRFLEIWKDCDPDLRPRLEEARARRHRAQEHLRTDRPT